MRISDTNLDSSSALTTGNEISRDSTETAITNNDNHTETDTNQGLVATTNTQDNSSASTTKVSNDLTGKTYLAQWSGVRVQLEQPG